MADRRASTARRSPGSVVLQVVAELLLTAGLVILLFLAWKLVWQELAVGADQQRAATDVAEEWARSGAGTGDVSAEPVVREAPGLGDTVGVLRVPRLGADYARVIGEGTRPAELNSPDLGIGHYVGTAMPGVVGNMALAAHRNGNGGAFHSLHELVEGDPIVVETEDGWHVYRYTSSTVVEPHQVEVIAPVPGRPGETPTQRWITLTTCDPMYSTAQRLIAYGLFDRFQPRDAGPPSELQGD